MYDSIRMHVFDSRYKLMHKVPGLLWSQFFTLFYHLAHGLFYCYKILCSYTAQELCTQILNLRIRCRIRRYNDDAVFYEF